jgi:hypothetical protein
MRFNQAQAKGPPTKFRLLLPQADDPTAKCWSCEESINGTGGATGPGAKGAGITDR